MCELVKLVAQGLRGIIACQSAVLGRDPENSMVILYDVNNQISGKRVRIIRFIIKSSEVRSVITVQSELRSDPEKPIPVLVEAGNFIIRQTIQGGKVFKMQLRELRLRGHHRKHERKER